MWFLSVVRGTESAVAAVSVSRRRIQTLKKLNEMIVTEFVTEIGNVIGKEIVIVSEGVAVLEKETENVNVVTETGKGIGGTENVIEETGISCDNIFHVWFHYFFS
jgi:hypothetical protein